MGLRPTNDNENRLRAGSVSALVWSFSFSATSPVFQRSGRREASGPFRRANFVRLSGNPDTIHTKP